MRRHPGDGARAAPGLNEHIIGNGRPRHFLPSDDGLAVRHDALSHAIKEIRLELVEILQRVRLMKAWTCGLTFQSAPDISSPPTWKYWSGNNPAISPSRRSWNTNVSGFAGLSPDPIAEK